MLTNVYVDGLNLYHRAVKGTDFKWLDVRLMVEKASFLTMILAIFITSRLGWRVLDMTLVRHSGRIHI